MSKSRENSEFSCVTSTQAFWASDGGSSPMRILHLLDHSIPLHSGYAFRTLAILREQRRLGWQTFHMTGPRQTGYASEEEEVEGLHFYRTPAAAGVRPRLPGLGEVAQMRQMQ